MLHHGKDIFNKKHLFWIGNTQVIDIKEFFLEYLLDLLYILESNISIEVLLFLYLFLNNSFHQRINSFGSRINQALGSSLYRIGHHKNSRLFGKRNRPRVSEIVLIERFP